MYLFSYNFPIVHCVAAPELNEKSAGKCCKFAIIICSSMSYRWESRFSRKKNCHILTFCNKGPLLSSQSFPLNDLLTRPLFVLMIHSQNLCFTRSGAAELQHFILVSAGPHYWDKTIFPSACIWQQTTVQLCCCNTLLRQNYLIPKDFALNWSSLEKFSFAQKIFLNLINTQPEFINVKKIRHCSFATMYMERQHSF